jgi:hypothetical protein
LFIERDNLDETDFMLFNIKIRRLSMFAVKGIYDGKTVMIDKVSAPKERYDVIVTFLEPLEVAPVSETARDVRRRKLARFCGVWSDEDYDEFQAAVKDFNIVDKKDWE